MSGPITTKTTERKHRRAGGLRKRCGHRPEQWPKCPHPWHLNFQWRGVHYRLSLDRHLGKHIESKGDAEDAASDIRKAIKAGKFGEQLPARDVLTVEQLLSAYIKDHVTPERPRSVRNAEYQKGAMCRYELALPTGERRRFGSWLVVDVTTGALEKFRTASREQHIRAGKDKDGKERRRRVGGTVTTNRNLGFLRAAFNWAVRCEYVASTPFKRNNVTVVKLSQEQHRRRRLEGDEGDRLLAASRPQLRALVEAAVETGCRQGKLLSLQWWQVRGLKGSRPEIDLPASKTKTKRDRKVPISARLKALLEMRRNDPNDKPHGPQAYVFGNEIGQLPSRLTPPGGPPVGARASRTCTSTISGGRRGAAGSRAACRC